MSCKPGVTRQGGVALVIAAVLLVFSGVIAGTAAAGPDKQPDRTLNDHPSGKDRTEEPGGNVQGKSTSDPDGDANGGADKPGGDGGFDDDKDGNNGCGNDDDFEDDNNGNCGGRRAEGGQAGNVDEQQKDAQGKKALGNAEVKSDVVVDTTDAAKSLQGESNAAVQALEDTQVLGVSFVREPDAAAAVSGVAVAGTTAAGAPAALAATGAPAVELAAIALVLIASGAALVVSARRRETLLA